MKSTRQNPVVSAFGVTDTSKFKIKPSAHAFRILSDGLYSDKILAVIRELSCNALDSHVEAGKTDIPFDIRLPNSLDPTFYVQDYGVGLSKEDAMQLYTTYFETTKSNTNDAIGMLGLGSKVPFAVTSSFNVESIFNGMRYTFTAFIADTGFPELALMAEEETTECNGLKISFAVDNRSHQEYKNKAKLALKYFNPKPNILGIEEGDIFPEYEVIMSGNGWQITNRSCLYDRNGCFIAIQGSVGYPVRNNDISHSPYYNSNKHRNILDCYVDAKFDIGTLDVSASREQLSFDDITIKNIIDCLDKIYDEIVENVKNQISNANTLWEAKCIYNQIIRHHRHNHLYPITRTIAVEWQGQTVTSDFFNIDTNNNHLKISSFISNSSNLKGYSKTREYSFEITATNDVELIIDDVGRGRDKRVGEYVAEIYKNSTKRNVYGIKENVSVFLLTYTEQLCPGDRKASLKLETDEMIKFVKEQLGNAPYKLVSQLPSSKSNESQKTNDHFMYEFVKSVSYQGDKLSWKDIEDHNEIFEHGGIYVPIHAWRPWKKTLNDCTLNYFKTLVNTLTKDYIIRPDVKIYGVKSKNVHKFEKAKQWVNFFDYVNEQLVKYFKKVPEGLEIVSHIVKYEQIQNFRSLANFMRYNKNRLKSWKHETDLNDVQKFLLTCFQIHETMSSCVVGSNVKKLIYKYTELNRVMDNLELSLFDIVKLNHEEQFDYVKNQYKVLGNRHPLINIIFDQRGALTDRQMKSFVDLINHEENNIDCTEPNNIK